MHVGLGNLSTAMPEMVRGKKKLMCDNSGFQVSSLLSQRGFSVSPPKLKCATVPFRSALSFWRSSDRVLQNSRRRFRPGAQVISISTVYTGRALHLFVSEEVGTTGLRMLDMPMYPNLTVVDSDCGQRRRSSSRNHQKRTVVSVPRRSEDRFMCSCCRYSVRYMLPR
jgi:hypothetical protein